MDLSQSVRLMIQTICYLVAIAVAPLAYLYNKEIVRQPLTNKANVIGDDFAVSSAFHREKPRTKLYRLSLH